MKIKLISLLTYIIRATEDGCLNVRGDCPFDLMPETISEEHRLYEELDSLIEKTKIEETETFELLDLLSSGKTFDDREIKQKFNSLISDKVVDSEKLKNILVKLAPLKELIQLGTPSHKTLPLISNSDHQETTYKLESLDSDLSSDNELKNQNFESLPQRDESQKQHILEHATFLHSDPGLEKTEPLKMLESLLRETKIDKNGIKKLYELTSSEKTFKQEDLRQYLKDLIPDNDFNEGYLENILKEITSLKESVLRGPTIENILKPLNSDSNNHTSSPKTEHQASRSGAVNHSIHEHNEDALQNDDHVRHTSVDRCKSPLYTQDFEEQYLEADLDLLVNDEDVDRDKVKEILKLLISGLKFEHEKVQEIFELLISGKELKKEELQDILGKMAAKGIFLKSKLKKEFESFYYDYGSKNTEQLAKLDRLIFDEDLDQDRLLELINYLFLKENLDQDELEKKIEDLISGKNIKREELEELLESLTFVKILKKPGLTSEFRSLSNTSDPKNNELSIVLNPQSSANDANSQELHDDPSGFFQDNKSIQESLTLNHTFPLLINLEYNELLSKLNLILRDKDINENQTQELLHLLFSGKTFEQEELKSKIKEAISGKYIDEECFENIFKELNSIKELYQQSPTNKNESLPSNPDSNNYRPVLEISHQNSLSEPITHESSLQRDDADRQDLFTTKISQDSNSDSLKFELPTEPEFFKKSKDNINQNRSHEELILLPSKKNFEQREIQEKIKDLVPEKDNEKINLESVPKKLVSSKDPLLSNPEIKSESLSFNTDLIRQGSLNSLEPLNSGLDHELQPEHLNHEFLKQSDEPFTQNPTVEPVSVLFSKSVFEDKSKKAYKTSKFNSKRDKKKSMPSKGRNTKDLMGDDPNIFSSVDIHPKNIIKKSGASKSDFSYQKNSERAKSKEHEEQIFSFDQNLSSNVLEPTSIFYGVKKDNLKKNENIETNPVFEDKSQFANSKKDFESKQSESESKKPLNVAGKLKINETQNSITLTFTISRNGS